MDEKWHKPEKEIARRAFDAAWQREWRSIADAVRAQADQIREPGHLWDLETYLREKRKEINEKYDFRYSVLIFVLGRLFREGWITTQDLEGLSPAKLARIQAFAS
jgi:hypothetical protein